MEKLFAVSTADALLIDPATDTLVVKGTANLDASMEQSIQESEIWAGRGSTLQTTIAFQKSLTFSISTADFSPVYVALQSGSQIKNELTNYFTEETVEFNAQGVATLDKAPIGGVYVEMPANYATYTAVGSTITVLPLAGKKVKVSYQFAETVDKIEIGAKDFPKAYKLVLTSDIFNADGDKVMEQQIVAERYKLDGALSMQLQHDSASQFTLNGKTLADDNNKYATISYRQISGASVTVNNIATDVSEVELAVGETITVNTIGIRQAPYSNVPLKPAQLTFTSDTPAKATFVNGVITGVATGTANLKVTYGTLTDIIKVTVVA